MNEFHGIYKSSFSHIEGTVLVISSSEANRIFVEFLPHVYKLKCMYGLVILCEPF